MSRRVAVVDMGSNTLKFSVTEVDATGVERILHAHAETVRLGAGVAVTGTIEPARIDRALLALCHYELIARSYGAEAYIGVATAALRMASNGDDLLDQIHRTTGWKVSVITGAEEARLAFEGISRSLPVGRESLVVDIGGGSTELLRIAKGDLVASESLAIGSGTLADRCFHHDPPGKSAMLDAAGNATETLAASSVLGSVETSALVLSGGNGQFLDAVASWREVNIPFAPERFRDLFNSLADIESRRLATYLGIAPERARMLPAGAAIAMAIIEQARPDSIAATPSGIRGGLLAHWFATHP